MDMRGRDGIVDTSGCACIYTLGGPRRVHAWSVPIVNFTSAARRWIETASLSTLQRARRGYRFSLFRVKRTMEPHRTAIVMSRFREKRWMEHANYNIPLIRLQRPHKTHGGASSRNTVILNVGPVIWNRPCLE